MLTEENLLLKDFTYNVDHTAKAEHKQKFMGGGHSRERSNDINSRILMDISRDYTRDMGKNHMQNINTSFNKVTREAARSK